MAYNIEISGCHTRGRTLYVHGPKVLQGQAKGVTQKEGVLRGRMHRKGVSNDDDQTTTTHGTVGAKVWNSVESFDD